MQTIVILLALLCAVVIAAICCNVFSKRASRAHSYIFLNVELNENGTATRGGYLANDGCYRAGAFYNDESVEDMRRQYEFNLDWFERFDMPEVAIHPSYWFHGLTSPATWRNLKVLCGDIALYVSSYIKRSIKCVENDALAIRLARRAHGVNMRDGLVYYKGVAQNRY